MKKTFLYLVCALCACAMNAAPAFDVLQQGESVYNKEIRPVRCIDGAYYLYVQDYRCSLILLQGDAYYIKLYLGADIPAAQKSLRYISFWYDNAKNGDYIKCSDDTNTVVLLKYKRRIYITYGTTQDCYELYRAEIKRGFEMLAGAKYQRLTTDAQTIRDNLAYGDMQLVGVIKPKTLTK